jgi:preprotein translocase SecE subunit
MTMAVVEQAAAPERLPQSPYQQLGLSSLLGAVLVLFCFAFVFGGLPSIYDALLGVPEEAIEQAASLGLPRPEPAINEFLGGTLLLLAMLAVGGALFWMLRELERASARPGLRAGVVLGAFALWFTLGLLTKLGAAMERGESGVMGLGMTVVIGAAVLAAIAWLFTRPGFGRWLVGLEEQGWFHAVSYKGNQGVRVRRGTILALLAVFFCGVYVLYDGWLKARRGEASDWLWHLPFTAQEDSHLYVPIMHKVSVVVPILLIALSVWAAWRVVNWPTFADFLIATEAEMNKVSWTTRRRLVQDTIVVLVTVFLFTAFLFLVDIMWIRVLTNPWVPILQVDIKEAFQKQQEKTQW